MRARLVILVLVAASLGACKRRQAVEEQETSPAPTASAKPIDHLAPDELIEGPERALGVPVPRGMTVSHAYVETVYVTGSVRQTALVKFLRERVRGGRQLENPRTGEVVFDRVKVPAEPAKELMINVETKAGATNMLVRDVTLPSTASAPTDEAGKWRAVGLTPDGKLADPRHLD